MSQHERDPCFQENSTHKHSHESPPLTEYNSQIQDIDIDTDLHLPDFFLL